MNAPYNLASIFIFQYVPGEILTIEGNTHKYTLNKQTRRMKKAIELHWVFMHDCGLHSKPSVQCTVHAYTDNNYKHL